MKLITVDNYEELSKVAARELASTIKEKPNAILGLATGGSPVGMYKELIKMYQDGELDFSKIKTVNLDEYVGLNPEHEQSYRHFMNENLFNHVNININNTIVPNGLAQDLNAECKEYDKKIEELGGIDVQLLGVGNNGHIAFNEPPEPNEVCTAEEFKNRTTRVLNISRETRTINAVGSLGGAIQDMPKMCITIGMKEILSARKIKLYCFRDWHGAIVREGIFGERTAACPLSLLRDHADVEITLTSNAAKMPY